MFLEIHYYECPHCQLSSSASITLSYSIFDNEVCSNGCPPYGDLNLRYLMCPFCKNIFLREIEREPNIQSKSFLTGKDVTTTIKEQNISVEENMKMFFKYYGDSDILKKYASDIIYCVPEPFIEKLSLFCDDSFLLINEDSSLFQKILKKHRVYKAQRTLLRRLQCIGNSSINNPSIYSREEALFLNHVLDIAKNKRLHISTIEYKGAEPYLTAFKQCKADDVLYKNILLHFIWEVEEKMLQSKDMSFCNAEYNLALQEIVKYLEQENTLSENDNLLKAEFYRRLGRFDDALCILNSTTFKNAESYQIASAMIEHLNERDRAIFTIEID